MILKKAQIGHDLMPEVSDVGTGVLVAAEE